MKETTNSLDQRLMDRMGAFKELAMVQDKMAECLEALDEFSEQTENKFLKKAANDTRRGLGNVLNGLNFHLVEIMLDGDPRYYPDEEE